MQNKILIGLALTLVVLVFIPVYLVTESGRQAESQAHFVALSVDRGAALYASNCSQCHGPGGEGNIGPALKGSPLDKDTLGKIISRGVPGTAMPAFGPEDSGPLNKDQISELVAFITNWKSVQPETPGTTGAQAGAPRSTVPVSTPTSAGAGKAIFDSKCGACHSIGGGRRPTGPDLKDVTQRRERDWLLRIITVPDQLISQGDPIVKGLVAEFGLNMPNLGLSRAEAEEVLKFIESSSGTAAQAPPVTAPPVTTPSTGGPALLPAGDAAVGRDIFTGRIPLLNGGGACLSCHNVNSTGVFVGGTLAKDMTDAYSRLGEAGLTAIIRTAPFPIMRDIYVEKPLTDGEIAHVVAFFKEASGQENAARTTSPVVILILSIAGFIIIVVVLQLIWRRRLSGVRQLLVKGGSK